VAICIAALLLDASTEDSTAENILKAIQLFASLAASLGLPKLRSARKLSSALGFKQTISTMAVRLGRSLELNQYYYCLACLTDGVAGPFQKLTRRNGSGFGSDKFT
jgi:hypothetical protein